MLKKEIRKRARVGSWARVAFIDVGARDGIIINIQKDKVKGQFDRRTYKMFFPYEAFGLDIVEEDQIVDIGHCVKADPAITGL